MNENVIIFFMNKMHVHQVQAIIGDAKEFVEFEKTNVFAEPIDCCFKFINK